MRAPAFLIADPDFSLKSIKNHAFRAKATIHPRYLGASAGKRVPRLCHHAAPSAAIPRRIAVDQSAIARVLPVIEENAIVLSSRRTK